MKLKHFITASIILAIPSFFSMLFVALIGFDNMCGGKCLKNIISGHANNTFIAILMCSGVVSISVILSILLSVTRHADKIDELDEAIFEAHKARRAYEDATEKFVEKFVENN
jgi:TM2 domain-containing membrane protein YozV